MNAEQLSHHKLLYAEMVERFAKLEFDYSVTAFDRKDSEDDLRGLYFNLISNLNHLRFTHSYEMGDEEKRFQTLFSGKIIDELQAEGRFSVESVEAYLMQEEKIRTFIDGITRVNNGECSKVEIIQYISETIRNMLEYSMNLTDELSYDVENAVKMISPFLGCQESK